VCVEYSVFFFSSRRRHTRCSRDWSSDVCSSDLIVVIEAAFVPGGIVWSALDHAAAGGDGHRIGENSRRPVDRLQDVLFGEMPKSFGPFDGRKLLREVEGF